MATIADVARRAGVSKSTASRVLNDASSAIRVSNETRARILSAARELAYRGNPFARAIRSSRSQLVGVVSVSLVHPFWVSVIESIEEVARQRGYYLLLSEATPSRKEPAAPDLLTADGVNALLLLGDVAVDEKWLASAIERGKCIVTVSTALDHANAPSVTLDNRQAIFLALEHLTGVGHQRIVLFGSPSTWEGRERIKAFKAFFASRNLPEPPDFVRPLGTAVWPASLGHLLADGVAALDALWSRAEPPTAIITSSSLRATGLIGHAHRRGIRIPDDLSVVTFADSQLVEHTIPPLTAIDQRVGEQGRVAATLALDLVEGKASPEQTHSISLVPQLVVRDSTGPAPQLGSKSPS